MQRLDKVPENNHHFINHILKGTIYNFLPLQELVVSVQLMKKSFFITSGILLFYNNFLLSNSVPYCKLAAALQ